MDTTPFHLVLFALDIFTLGGLFLWLRSRHETKTAGSARFQYEKSLYTRKVFRSHSYLWDLTGIVLFGSFYFICFAFLSRLIFTDYVQKYVYNFNVGQCIVEGIAIHGTLFLAVTAALLCWKHRYQWAAIFGGEAIILAGICFNALYWEPYHVKIEYYRIETEKVKGPVRIVFVSDIQADHIGSHEINTLKKIQRLDADLIILGGDYIQAHSEHQKNQLPERFRQMLLDYPLTAPLGVYAVAGNISGADVRDAELFQETGIEYFQVSTIIPDLGEAEKIGPIDLVLLGLGHSWGGLGKHGLTESGNFIVMAGHCPNYAIDGWTNPKTGNSLSGYRKAEKTPDLMLAGHTHGGQVVIPFYGPLTGWGDERVDQVPPNMMSGFHKYPNGGHLLVTRGSGMERGWAPRIRLFCPPEISVIDIVLKE